MRKNLYTKTIGFLTAASILVTLGACSAEKKKDAQSATTVSQETAKVEETKEVAKNVTLRLLSNLPDRKSGQGLLEETMMTNYKQENPNVSFEVETLKDTDFDQKIKAYVASNNMPDVYFMQGMKSKITPLMGAKAIHGFDPSEFDGYGFVPGAMDAFTFDGKVYGLPRNSDFMALYYNKDLFDSNAVKVPETWEDLMAAVKVFNEKGITPIAAMNKEGWTEGLLMQEIMLKVSGNQKEPYDALNRTTKFTGNENFLKATQLFQELTKSKAFQKSHLVADYNAGKNLFTQGKAAMLYMGEWEMGMAADQQIPDEIRKNIHVTYFPTAGDKTKKTDILAWMASGYSIAAETKNKEDAVKFFKWIFKPENWAKNAWDMGVCFPAQKVEKTGNENPVQAELLEIFIGLTSSSGTPFMDSGSPKFKDESTKLFQGAIALMITPEKMLEDLDKAAEEDAKSK